MIQQLNIFEAQQGRDKGIKKAIDHADRVHNVWSDKAFDLLKLFIRARKEFMAEDFRQAVEGMLPKPPSNRAFGGVFMKAAKSGLITRVRYAPVKNVRAHCANASVWKRA